MQVTRNLYSRLSERLVTIERRFYTKEQYSRMECLESFGIPTSAADNSLESDVLVVLEEIDVPIDPGLVEDCHCLLSKSPPRKFIIRLN